MKIRTILACLLSGLILLLIAFLVLLQYLYVSHGPAVIGT